MRPRRARARSPPRARTARTHRSPRRTDIDAWLVLGLGNPGPSYTQHRHNAGYWVVAELARRAGVRLSGVTRLRAEVAETRLTPGGIGAVGDAIARVVLATGRTYMNELGGPARKLCDYYKIAPERLIVVHDELDIDLGQIRLKLGGGDNGHNGLKSIRAALGTGDFHRVRFGIGRPPGRQDPITFVLSPFPAAARPQVELEVDRAADAVESLISNGLADTQTRFNS